MEPVRLTRARFFDWKLEGTRLHVSCINPERKSWHIAIPYCSDEWYARNAEVTSLHFSRLRDVREFLQALLASDPLPESLQELPSGSHKARLRRVRPGEYEVSLTEHDPPLQGTLQARDNGSGWDLCDLMSSVQDDYVTLNEARMHVAEDMEWLHQHHHGMWATSAD